jgi:23S rRNA (cytosine1962-C5)-methyltransferase
VRTIKLKKNEDRRLRAGHLWVFSNEIANITDGFTPGEIVDIINHAGRFVGRGYINPHSLISARVLTREKETIDERFFASKIERALALRRRMLPDEQACRVVFGEADGLPGLVIDKYADVLALQISTLGMYSCLGLVLGALPATDLPARTVVLRADTPLAALEGFSGESRVLVGALEGAVTIEHDGLLFDVDVRGGQKTGFYLDQRENRRTTARVLKGLKVLDCFCYTGAWSLYAGAGGAEEVLGIDSSEKAIAMARDNAERNRFGEVCRFDTADAFERLDLLVRLGEKFGCVILDPPGLVKSKRHLKQGEAAYERLNRLAMELLSPDGLLISCSCSYHVSGERFRHILSSAARKCRRGATLVEMRGQARDHPTLLAMPETSYLKCAVLRIA